MFLLTKVPMHKEMQASRGNETGRTTQVSHLNYMNDTKRSPQDVLRQHWGHDTFRGPQLDAIVAAVAGDDVFVMMATGGGKSLIIQIPPLVMKKPGFIISPLISLMQDQVGALVRRGIKACLLGSAQASSDVRVDAMAGKYELTYMTPELALKSIDALSTLHRTTGIGMVAIDEAHCISEWGHDYRPDFLRLGELRKALPGVPFVAVTATATPRVQREILNKLVMFNERLHIFRTSFERPNLRFEVARHSRNTLPEVAELCRRMGPTVVYVLTTRQADEVADALNAMNGLSAAAYHAKLAPDVKLAAHTAFLDDDKLDVIVATIAYGMGIDKPNVRAVVHLGAPGCLEAYYQQAGRAGRDGKSALCRIYHSPSDVMTLDFVRGQSHSQPLSKVASDGTTHMQAYVSSQSCRAALLVNHFLGPRDTMLPIMGPCEGTCDSCDMRVKRLENARDMKVEVLAILKATRACNGRYGVGRVIDLVTGQNKGKVPAWLAERYSTSTDSTDIQTPVWWRGLMGLLVADGLVEYRSVNSKELSFSAPSLTQRANELLKSSSKAIMMSPSVEMLAEETMLTKNIMTCMPKRKKTKIVIDVTDEDRTTDKTNNHNACLHLEAELRKWRKNRATKIGKPAYVILTDKSLASIVETMPTDIASLLECHGIGPTKSALYGRDIIDLSISALQYASACTKPEPNPQKSN